MEGWGTRVAVVTGVGDAVATVEPAPLRSAIRRWRAVTGGADGLCFATEGAALGCAARSATRVALGACTPFTRAKVMASSAAWRAVRWPDSERGESPSDDAVSDAVGEGRRSGFGGCVRGTSDLCLDPVPLAGSGCEAAVGSIT